MPFMEKDDLEMSYRRGYERGAAETFEAVERFLDPRTREIVRTWIERTSTDGGARPCSVIRRSGGWLACAPRGRPKSMIPKSGYRFSEKIMLQPTGGRVSPADENNPGGRAGAAPSRSLHHACAL
jgi:hypothetical protein